MDHWVPCFKSSRGSWSDWERVVTFEGDVGLDTGVVSLDGAGEVQELWGSGWQLLAAGCFLLGSHVMTDLHPVADGC